LKVAGLFFSIKKCPTHANAYPDNNANRRFRKLKLKKKLIKKTKPILVPIMH
jgi:hypothetical protein